MTPGRAETSRTWVAILAAYVTALNLVLVGLSPAGGAAPFGPVAVLCAHDGDGRPVSPLRRDGSHAVDCCLAGCVLHAALPAPAPSPAVLRRWRAMRTTSPVALRRDRGPQASPLRIRGPPGRA